MDIALQDQIAKLHEKAAKLIAGSETLILNLDKYPDLKTKMATAI